MKLAGFASSLYISSPRFALAGCDNCEILSRRLPGFPKIQADEFVTGDIRIIFHLSIEDLEALQLLTPHRVEVSRERNLVKYVELAKRWIARPWAIPNSPEHQSL